MNIKIKTKSIIAIILVLAMTVPAAGCAAQAAKLSLPDISEGTDTVTVNTSADTVGTEASAQNTAVIETDIVEIEPESDDIMPVETESEPPETEAVTEPFETEPDTESVTEAETAPPETTKASETTKTSETAKFPEMTKSSETTKSPEPAKSSETVGNPANWTSSYVGTAEQEEKARKVAKQIADSIGPGTDLERIQKATASVNAYQCKQREDKHVYMTAYSVFLMGESCCWGYTSALGMVLDYMGYTWRRGNYGTDPIDFEVEWMLGVKHQWVILENIDGHTAYADAQAGRAYYGTVYGEQSFSAAHDDSCTETVITAPTCTEKGMSFYTCNICGASAEDRVGSLGHDWVVSKVITPTEVKRGYTVYACSRCDETWERDYTYATKTCDENGFEHSWDYRGTCTLCGTLECILNYGEHIWEQYTSFSVTYVRCKYCYMHKCVYDHGDHYWMPGEIDPLYLEDLLPGERRYELLEEWIKCYYCGITTERRDQSVHGSAPA